MVKSILKELFPYYKIKEEKYVQYGNNKLLFDYCIEKLKLLVEVQGEQHFEFNRFFHNSELDFYNQKKRDFLKEEWAVENGYSLIKINYSDKVNKKFISKIIKEALNA